MLSPRQVRFYNSLVDIWRFTENPPAADGQYQGRSWSQIAANVPCHFVMRGGPQGPQAFLIRAEGEDLITMDRFHFALDTNIDVDDEVKVLTGKAAGKWWKLTEEPEIREWRANKLEVIGIRIERPTGGN
jgi:hypothetical protein